jgi:SAM-dependent methyltransferase
MSFSPEWLALREPVDHASVNSQVREALRRYFTRHTSIRVVDLGCGTGSNVRGTAGALGRRQTWTLVDYDPKLLKAAAFRLENLERGMRTKSGVRFAVDDGETWRLAGSRRSSAGPIWLPPPPCSICSRSQPSISSSMPSPPTSKRSSPC